MAACVFAAPDVNVAETAIAGMVIRRNREMKRGLEMSNWIRIYEGTEIPQRGRTRLSPDGDWWEYEQPDSDDDGLEDGEEPQPKCRNPRATFVNGVLEWICDVNTCTTHCDAHITEDPEDPTIQIVECVCIQP